MDSAQQHACIDVSSNHRMHVPKLTLRGNKLPKKISCLYLSGLGGVRFLPAYTFQISVCACIQIEQKFRWISSSLHAASHGPWQYPSCHLF